MSKRIFDLLLSGLGLLVLVLPFLLIAAAIKLDTRGPVFFRQVRVGRYGREFHIHKFRTMRHPPGDNLSLVTVDSDPRITRVGHWLRRYKLDELPQLFDVLEGDMSLVGPRPEVPKYVSMYPAEVRTTVLSIRPGITDEASMAFRRESEMLAGSLDPEAAYVQRIMPTKLAIYQRYVGERTMAGDVVILLKTLALLIARH
jgi:lipopolysaccharide/colanic/teichoic acid biosynthesis glycosyltransferase